jgi:hypothetical protein
MKRPEPTAVKGGPAISHGLKIPVTVIVTPPMIWVRAGESTCYLEDQTGYGGDGLEEVTENLLMERIRGIR